ncbi:MAG: 30S ribosomal protein S9 [Solirubrobacterales bacterium]
MSEENEQPTEDQQPQAAEPEAPAPDAAEEAPTEAPEETPTEAPEETPTGADPEPQTPEPQAPTAAPEVDSDAADAPEAPAESEEGDDEPTESASKRKPTKPAAEKPKDVVPGADLDPIAITEERELSAEEQAALEAEEEERAAREAAAEADDEDEIPARKATAVPKGTSIQSTGKRKSSIARVLLRAGDGKLEINGREITDYFPRSSHQMTARQPLVASGYDGNVNLQIRVHGGGISGQAGAVRHGIARALVELEPELRGELKKRGLLTRDAREKERRKAGLKKARKRPQFSKR